MKNFTLRKLGFLALLLLMSAALLTAQEKRSITVVKKIKNEDGTVTIERDQLEADALISGYLKEDGKMVGNDVEIHLSDSEDLNVEIDKKTGETLIFVRSASDENTDVERMRVAWHSDDEQDFDFNFNHNWNDHDGEKNATGRTILGIYTDDHADVEGLRISSVSEGKGAEAAGLRGGDVITFVDGKRITDTKDLRAAIGGYGNGDEVGVTYLRDGQTLKTTVALTAERLQAREVQPCEVFIGVGTNSHRGEGVKVNYVIDDTPAAASNIRAGDIILALDGVPVNNQHELETERDKHQPGEDFQLKVLRGDQPMTINARFKECTEEERARIQQQREEKMAALEERMIERRNRTEGLTRISQSQRPILGVYTDNDGSDAGLRLSSVSSGKGAELAGIRGGDILTVVDGNPVKTTSDLREAIADRQPGDRVQVSYLQNGELKQTEVVLSGSTMTYSWTVERDPCDVFIGIYSSSRGSQPGVRVTGVIEGTSAMKYGIQRGDVILALDDISVNNHNEVITERDKHEPGDWYKLSILRNDEYIELDAQFNPCDQEESLEQRITKVEEVVQIEEQADMPQDEATESDMPNLNLDTELQVEEWRMFPNPTVGMLNVNFRAPAKPTTIRITDTAGKTIYNEVLNQFDGFYNNQLNLTGATPGTYILSVQQDGKMITKKIILMPRV